MRLGKSFPTGIPHPSLSTPGSLNEEETGGGQALLITPCLTRPNMIYFLQLLANFLAIVTLEELQLPRLLSESGRVVE